MQYSRHINNEPLLSKLHSLTINVLSLLAPRLAYRMFIDRLQTPRKIQHQWSCDVDRFSINTPIGKIRAFAYGEGEDIWLVHGWSGHAHQYWPLMQALAEKGYRAIALELPAHGYSRRNQVSIPQLIRAFDSAARKMFSPKMIIAHSIGATVVANASWFKNYQDKLILVEPTFDPYLLQYEKMSGYRFNDAYFERYVHHILKRDKALLTNLGLVECLMDFTGETHIIHEAKSIDAVLEQVPVLAKKPNVALVCADENNVLESDNIIQLLRKAC
ncbi:alpha/beta hydrolase [Thalassotalea euphylliae]|uniref:alpha/beta hydrolase n=1 Tax=Thalassotalea euphylliae TaxID=1655234 RepID=UPI0036457CBE